LPKRASQHIISLRTPSSTITRKTDHDTSSQGCRDSENRRPDDPLRPSRLAVAPRPRGEERLLGILREARAESPFDIVRRITAEIESHNAGEARQDDITLVALKRTP